MLETVPLCIDYAPGATAQGIERAVAGTFQLPVGSFSIERDGIAIEGEDWELVVIPFIPSAIGPAPGTCGPRVPPHLSCFEAICLSLAFIARIEWPAFRMCHFVT